jgi:hypothetical protein
MIFRKKKNAAEEQADPDPEIPLTDQEYAEDYDLIFNCAFDGPRSFVSTELYLR